MKMFFMKGFLFVCIMLLPTSRVVAHSDHDHQENHAEDNREELTLEAATAAGIVTAIAGPGLIRQEIKTFGRLIIDPEKLHQVKARYPGLVTQVSVSLGAKIKQGDLLAVIEANDSLRSYRITAPATGIIQSRNINPGDITGDQPLFVIAEEHSLIAELHLFPKDVAKVKPGQKVNLENSHTTGTGQVKTISPLNNSSVNLVRVALNKADEMLDKNDGWIQGESIVGNILITEETVAVRIENSALQEVRGNQIIFVLDGEKFEPWPLELGKSDNHYKEVSAGLQSGDIYAVKNAYLLKAHLEKSSAAHEH